MIQTSIQARRTLGSIAASMLASLAIPASAQVQLFHPTNTVWRYQTNLVEQQAAGVDWVNPGFDDSMWPEGKGLFGNEANYPYPMNTVIPSAAAGPFIAVYYRAHFTWNGNTASIVLFGMNYVDDGSIIYLNGVEIARFNMPPEANAATPEAMAPVANPGGYPNVNGGEPVLVRLEIDLNFLTNGNANPLVPGDNVIAVQVHQNSPASSDRVFGLSLFGQACVAPCFTFSQPTNRVSLVGRSTTFTFVEQCAVPAPSFQWCRDTGFGEELIPGATSASYTITNVTISDTGVYYAKATTSCGTVSSRQATLTVAGGPEPPRLLSGRLGTDNLEIIVTADEALCPDDSCAGNATLTSSWEIFIEGNESDQLNIANVTVSGSVLTFTLDEFTPWLPDTRYVVRLVPYFGSLGDLYGNLLNGGDPFSSVTIPAMASAISLKGIMGISDLYTFDEPPNSLEFSTFNWAGGAADVSSAATLNTFVQALDVSAITTTLPEATGNPPGGSGIARYASQTKNLITRPAGVIGNVILAHLRNDSGSPAGMVTLNYTLTNREPNVAEGIPGLRVYSSLSGAPHTWNPVYVSPNEDANGPKTAIVDLRFSPWPARADMYILFVDDNAPGFEVDGIYEIDNFRAFIGHIDFCDTNSPMLTRTVSRDNTTIVLTFSDPMEARAGTVAPYSVSGATVTAAFLNSSGNEVWLTTTPRSVGNATVTITGITGNSSFCGPNLIYPNPTTVRITTVQKVVDWNSPWEYNTNNFDAASDWNTTGGTGWQTGNALFGTELSAGVVAIMPAPIATVVPPPNTNNEFMVSYFRKTVTLPPLSAGQSYAIGYMIGDGAVFYLDGEEIGRVNMPAGPVAHGTNAVAGIEGALLTLPFTATSGAHTLAVEVHQNANTSSDMLFGASVIIVPTASPSLTITQSGTNALVSWNADSSWVLVNSTNVAGPYTAVGGAVAPRFSRPITTPATQFYKLDYVPQP